MNLSSGLLTDDAGCKRPVHVCARSGTTGGVRHLTDFVAARFALDEASARLGENDYQINWPSMGDGGSASDRTDGDTYDVTWQESDDRKPQRAAVEMTLRP